MLKGTLLIGQNRTKRAKFRGSPLLTKYEQRLLFRTLAVNSVSDFVVDVVLVVVVVFTKKKGHVVQFQ